MFSRCRQILKLRDFTLFFGKLRLLNVLKCVPHVNRDFFPSLPKITSLFSGARFANVTKLFGWHKPLFIFNKNSFQVLKLGSYFAFPCIWNVLKEQLLTTSKSLLQELLFGSDKLQRLSRNGPWHCCCRRRCSYSLIIFAFGHRRLYNCSRFSKSLQ